MRQRQIGTTTYPVTFFMADSADSRTGKTGLTPTVTLSKSGAAFGAASGAVSEIGNGWYALAGHATDRSALGDLAIHATASGADSADVVVEIVTHDPFDMSAPSAAGCNKIADHVLRRSLASAAASVHGDAVGFRSLLGAVRKLVNKIAVAAGVLSIYDETDAGTPAGTQALTTDSAAEPITGADTA